MYKKSIGSTILIFLLALPVAGLADFNPGPAPITLADLSATDAMNRILNIIWPFFIGFAIIMFLVAGFSFLASMGDPTKVAGARMAILWGIVGVIVGILAFSLPFIIRNTLGF